MDVVCVCMSDASVCDSGIFAWPRSIIDVSVFVSPHLYVCVCVCVCVCVTFRESLWLGSILCVILVSY